MPVTHPGYRRCGDMSLEFDSMLTKICFYGLDDKTNTRCREILPIASGNRDSLSIASSARLPIKKNSARQHRSRISVLSSILPLAAIITPAIAGVEAGSLGLMQNNESLFFTAIPIRPGAFYFSTLHPISFCFVKTAALATARTEISFQSFQRITPVCFHS